MKLSKIYLRFKESILACFGLNKSKTDLEVLDRWRHRCARCGCDLSFGSDYSTLDVFSPQGYFSFDFCRKCNENNVIWEWATDKLDKNK